MGIKGKYNVAVSAPSIAQRLVEELAILAALRLRIAFRKVR